MNKNITAVLIIIIIVAVGLFGYVMSRQQAGDVMPDDTTPAADQQVRLYIMPAEATVAVGEQVTADILLDTNGQNMVAAEVDLAYDAELLSVDEISYDSSVFSITAEETIADGLITLARGIYTPGVNGEDLVVARITFTALGSGEARLDVLTDGAEKVSKIILDDGNGTDVLDAGYGAVYTIQ